jgi:hypothetical protein
MLVALTTQHRMEHARTSYQTARTTNRLVMSVETSDGKFEEVTFFEGKYHKDTNASLRSMEIMIE